MLLLILFKGEFGNRSSCCTCPHRHSTTASTCRIESDFARFTKLNRETLSCTFFVEVDHVPLDAMLPMLGYSAELCQQVCLYLVSEQMFVHCPQASKIASTAPASERLLLSVSWLLSRRSPSLRPPEPFALLPSGVYTPAQPAREEEAVKFYNKVCRWTCLQCAWRCLFCRRTAKRSSQRRWYKNRGNSARRVGNSCRLCRNTMPLGF